MRRVGVLGEGAAGPLQGTYRSANAQKTRCQMGRVMLKLRFD